MVTGAKSQRLHEEVVCSGGLIRNGRFSRLSVTQLEELTKASTPTMPGMDVLDPLLESWPNVEDSIVRAVEVRSRDRMRYLENTLQRRRDKEIEDRCIVELKAKVKRGGIVGAFSNVKNLFV